jgi:hypothetical protein
MRKSVLIVGLPMLFLGCKKEDAPIDDSIPHNSTTVAVAFHWFFGTESYSADSLYADDFGTLIQVDGVNFYLSNIWFEDDAGDSVAGFPEKYLLIRSKEAAEIRTVGLAEAHLHDMHLDFGLDSTANYTDPALYPDLHPLRDPSYWWGWATGRVFARIMGKYDLDGDGQLTGADGVFSYDCGTMPLRRSATITVDTDANMGSTALIDLDVDVQRILQGVDVINDPVTHTMDNMPLAIQVMNNLAVSVSHP